MKIVSNKTFDCYETAYESWSSGKDITLDGVKLIPITVLDEIRAEIMKLDYIDEDKYEGTSIDPQISRDDVLEIVEKALMLDKKEIM